MEKKRLTPRKLVLTVLVGALAMLFLMPLLWMFSSALKTPMQVFENPFRWIADRLHWENFLEVWSNTDVPFWKAFVNSLIISVTSVIGQLIVASLAAYAFAKIEFKGRNFVFMLMLSFDDCM